MTFRSVGVAALLLLLAGCAASPTVTVPPRPHGILLIVPEADTTAAGFSQYRLSGSTSPGSTLTLNGAPLRVYPTGAFGGLLPVKTGENVYTLEAVAASGARASRTFVINRPEGPTSTPADTLVIENARMEPAADLLLRAGDQLRVQCKGTPGMKATFLDGIPMREMPPSEAGGFSGIYRGIYTAKATDTAQGMRVTFRLEDTSGRSVTARSRGRVSFLPGGTPMVGVVKGERPYLNHGLGEDRLGGAKFSFLPAGVRLALDGKWGDQYRVRLTEVQEAWIPEALVDVQPAGTFLPSSLTGNITLSGDTAFDYVALTLSDKLPFSTWQEEDPARVHVDVYGAMANTNWITHLGSAREVSAVSYTQPAAGTFRLTLSLRHSQVWGYEVTYRGNTLVVKVRRQPADLDLGRLTIAVDAGHGGSNQGALGSTGAKEKDVNLAMARHLKTELERRGARVFMTRDGEEAGGNTERLRAVVAANADLLVSIHSNSTGLTSNPLDAQGIGTFYKHICYRPLAVAVLEEVLKTGLRNGGTVGNFNFTLNSATELPSVLVETAFMSHPEDEMKLLDDGFRKEIAVRIADGLERFLEGCEEE